MQRPKIILYWGIVQSLILFSCASIRHLLFNSHAFDLGWFDQATYLISMGKPPIVSFSGFHILGDHGAWIFYPLAALYWIYPSVYWLFAVQAIALSLGGILAAKLAQQAGLSSGHTVAIALVYNLYPVVFNANLFDFHPDTLAVPAILGAVLALRSHRFLTFFGCILLILGCKAILSLTVVGLGLWIVLSERPKWYGFWAMLVGTAWFIFTTQWIFPHFTGMDAAVEMSDGRYDYLGESIGEMIQTLILQPHRILGPVLSLANLEYLVLLFAPIFWILRPRYSLPLIGAAPALILNLITTYQPQKDLVHQYALPILPFFILTAIAILNHNPKSFIYRPKFLIAWATIGFLALGKYYYFGSLYLEKLDTWATMRDAIAQVEPNVGVITQGEYAPHLTHRRNIYLIDPSLPQRDLTQIDAILFNRRHPGEFPDTIETAQRYLESRPDFTVTYNQNDVLLFQKIAPDSPKSSPNDSP
jgi:uncharacterized membrane protein